MHLSLVQQKDVLAPPPPLRVLVVGEGSAHAVTAAIRDVPVPLVSLLLGDYCRLDGLIETRMEYGLQVAAVLHFLWRGRRRSVRAAIVPLVDGPSLVLPRHEFGDMG